MNVLVCIHSPFAAWNIPPAQVERLRREFPGDTFLHALNDEAALGMIGETEVAFAAQITPAQLEAAARLRWIQSPAAGIGGMLFKAMIESPVAITNARGLSADTIAEHVLAVTLALFRRLPHALRSQMHREWAQDAINREGTRLVSASNVLIVGLGAIGRATARRFAVLGARVTGVRRNPSDSVEGVTHIADTAQLDDLLPSADVVVVAAPHTRETRGMIGAPQLELMREDAILVNVSRGQLIDEAALLGALQANRIAAAALDVFVDEPLPPDSPFWTLPNVLITPHTSGFRPDHWDAATTLFSDNFRRYKAGERLVNLVDKHAGY